jgi:hypothetical protein
MQKQLSFYHVICHIWPQIWYFVWKIVWKIVYKPIEIFHVENVILGKDFNLGATCSLFHAFIPIKTIQFAIGKCTTWPPKNVKGKWTWDKACIEFKLKPRKLNTSMKIR